MKKITLFTAAAVSLTIFSTMPMTTEAANCNTNYKQLSCNNKIVLSDTNTADIQSLLNSIKEQQGSNCQTTTIPCLPSTESIVDNTTEPTRTEKPCVKILKTTQPTNNNCNQSSNTNKPDVKTPETQTPDVSQPETQIPEQKTPETKVPETKVPETKETEESKQLTYAEQVVNLVNAERAKNGLQPLTIKEDIRTAAQVRAMEIQTSFSHTRPDGRSFVTALQEQKVSYGGAGENIAWGQHTPEQVMEAWMNSEGHRANILNPKYTSIGVGYYQNAKGVNYWTQLFTY